MGGFLSHQTAIKSDVILNATCGPVRGNIYEPTTGKRVFRYLGIPYAQPPVGKLRFKKPEPADRWVEPLNCYAYGPRCPQLVTVLPDKPAENEAACLNLNVFTPEWKSEEFPSGRPVMVFIHGGAFELSSSSDYCDKSFAGSLPVKDVVLVTINYRHGIFGFLTTGDSTCPGNFGLWDQTLALKWVQSHIESFGGDPNNVTVFGESAGGCSTDLLSLSPHSRDLFKRSILMSGTADCNFAMRPRKLQSDLFREFAVGKGYVGDDSQSLLEWYQQQSSGDLKWGIDAVTDSRPAAMGPLLIAPVNDGDFFPKGLADLRKEAGSREVMVGTCAHEGLILEACEPKLPPMEAFERALTRRIKNCDYGDKTESVRERLRRSYFHTLDLNDDKLVERVTVLLGSDDFLCGTMDTVTRLSAVDSRIFLYELTFFEPNSFGFLNDAMSFQAATHTTDLRYVTGEGVYSKFEPTENDMIVHDNMTTWWTNFAKYGTPNGKIKGDWALYEDAWPLQFFCISLPTSSVMENYQDDRYEQVWKEMLEMNSTYQHTHHEKVENN